jgi:hypothetical protein
MTAATAGSVLNDDSGEGDERSILPPSPPPPAFSPTPLVFYFFGLIFLAKSLILIKWKE